MSNPFMRFDILYIYAYIYTKVIIGDNRYIVP